MPHFVRRSWFVLVSALLTAAMNFATDQASALGLRDCSDKLTVARALNWEIGNLTFEEFQKLECGAESTPVRQPAVTSASQPTPLTTADELRESCPSFPIGDDVVVVRALASNGDSAPIMRPFDRSIYRMYGEHRVNVRVRVPQSVFLVLVGKPSTRWVPETGPGSRIVGVMTINEKNAKIYRPGSILNATQLMQVADLKPQELGALCSIAAGTRTGQTAGYTPSIAFVSGVVQAVTGRNIDRTVPESSPFHFDIY
jgi:hypothetical protein